MGDSPKKEPVTYVGGPPKIRHPDKLFWLSFADPDKPKGEQFLGACAVRSAFFHIAIVVATHLGINPGGEVEGHEIVYKDGFELADEDIERLLTQEDIDRIFGGTDG